MKEVQVGQKVKLTGVTVQYNNIAKPDNFGKNNITVFSHKMLDMLPGCTTIKPGGVVKCSGKIGEKNVFIDEGVFEDEITEDIVKATLIEPNDVVDVLVEIRQFDDSVYPKLLAIRLKEKFVVGEEQSYEDEI